MSYAVGVKALVRLCIEQDPLAWHKAKLGEQFFRASEVEVYKWVEAHVSKHHVLPNVKTLVGAFPDLTSFVEAVPEPPSYYVEHLENRYFYERLNKANLDSQALLHANQADWEKAVDIMSSVVNDIRQQKYRVRITSNLEAHKIVMDNYHLSKLSMLGASFGWPYLDKQGIVQEGEIVSYIGRPQAGKSWLTLYGALHNFKRKLDPGVKRRNVLFVSMEMMTVPILQRLSSMYTGCPISDLKSGFSSDTYLKFDMTLEFMSKEENRMYVVDGNLAASVEDIYSLADSLNCSTIYVDGAYLLRHKNIKLDRFTRAAENIELMKRYTTDLGMVTFSSWQFNREATKKKGKGNEDAGLEDIGYSDAIGQISSVVLGLFIDDSAESVGKRNVRVLKGRNGEVGQFSINWDFKKMNFDQVDPPVGEKIEEGGQDELQFV